MNIRISKSWEWQSGIVLDSEFAINTYTVSVEMLTKDDNELGHRRAMERQHWWFQNVMQDAVLMEYDNPLKEAYETTGQRILSLPYTPVDHVILIMLYCKLNAIMEQNLVVTQIHLSSILGDGVVYSFSQDDDLMGFSLDGWWCEPSPIWANSLPQIRPDHVINIDRQPDWHDLGLAWYPHNDDSSVVEFHNGKK